MREMPRGLPVFAGELPEFDLNGAVAAGVPILKDVTADGRQFASDCPRAEAPLGRQRTQLGDLAERDAAVAEALERIERQPDLLVPGAWALYTVRPESMEFWRATSSAPTRLT
jgi:pyridoxine/pyridoxamine 5'-phosphate oxidase